MFYFVLSASHCSGSFWKEFNALIWYNNNVPFYEVPANYLLYGIICGDGFLSFLQNQIDTSVEVDRIRLRYLTFRRDPDTIPHLKSTGSGILLWQSTLLLKSTMKCDIEYRDTVVHHSYLWTYDLKGPIRNAFDPGKSITRASGRGLGPGNGDFWALWNGIESTGECHLGPKIGYVYFDL